MKANSISIVVLVYLLFICCTGNSGSVGKGNNTEAHKLEQAGWATGRGHEFVPRTKAEQNLVSQHNTYGAALFTGNIEEMKSFFYSDALSYYRKYYPSMSNDEILDEFLKDMSDEFIEMIHAYEEAGITFSLYINDVLRQVEYENDYLYVYGVCCRMEGIKNDTIAYLHSDIPDLTLGISTNHGRNWRFMAMTDEVPSILKMKYPQEIVNQVMGY